MAEKKEVKVTGKELVTIEYTAKSRFHKQGQRSVVHEIVAKKLYDKGVATIIKK